MVEYILSNAQANRYVHFFHTKKALQVMLLASGIQRKGPFCRDGLPTQPSLTPFEISQCRFCYGLDLHIPVVDGNTWSSAWNCLI